MTTDLDGANWWGGADRNIGRPTLLGLIGNHTLDSRTAALLWLLVEKKTSIVSAAMPQLAGKTTLLTTLLDFAPPQYDKILTQGMEEDFSFMKSTDPTRSYVMVPEFSNHTPSYLWGDKVRTLFEALRGGHSMVATIHADTPEEALHMLEGFPVLIPPDLLHYTKVIVNLKLLYDQEGMARRVSRVTLVLPGPKLVTLVDWQQSTDSWSHVDSTEAHAALSRIAGMTQDEIDADLPRRIETLESWIATGNLEIADVQGLVAEYYAS